jgi:hypothetical protein
VLNFVSIIQFYSILLSNDIFITRLHHAQSDDAIIDTELCYENMVRFKKFSESLNYNGPIAAMTDNTKLKERLSYSATLGCVIGSTLPTSEIKASNYEEIIAIIDKIKAKML